MTSIPCGRTSLMQQRAVLAELFRSGERAISDFTDSRVCRLYLCGCCPASLFVNSKFAMAACTKVHDDTLRGQYEAALAKGGPCYDSELLYQVEDILQRMERRSVMDSRRAEEDEGPNCVIPRVDTENPPEVQAVAAEIAAKERELESAGSNIVAAGALEEALEALARKKCLEQAKACRLPPVTPVPEGKVAHPRLRICVTCGQHVNLVDADDRTADHFQGRGHLGHYTAAVWAAKLRAAKASKAAAAAASSGSGGAGGGGGLGGWGGR